jgi:hypothetical protein
METLTPRTREPHGNSANNNNTGLVTNSTLNHHPHNLPPTALRKRSQCGCGSLVGSNERLEYDYTSQNNKKKNVRCRERGEYYIDSYNDLPMSWSFGTHETVRFVGAALSIDPAQNLTYFIENQKFNTKEWNMVQFQRSGGQYHVRHGVDTDVI